MEIEWKCKAFTDLTVQEFHDMVQLREKVFVVEQDCPYLDVDGKDPISLHLFAYDKSKMTMVAVSRIVLQKREFGEVSIGRVVTNGDYRGLSLGKKLMQNSIDKVLEMRGCSTDQTFRSGIPKKVLYGARI